MDRLQARVLPPGTGVVAIVPSIVSRGTGKAHQAGELRFYNDHSTLIDPQVFADWLRPLRRQEWVVYAKRPFAGPEAVLAYLSRYTHRVAIANSRLITLG